jgi:hypothetical protein
VDRVPKTHRRQRKKLAQAARLWASGQLDTTQDDDDDTAQTVDTALAIWGLQADPDQSASPATAQNTFYIWPECMGTWGLWKRIQTQWRTGMGGREGLDYPGVTTYLREVCRIKPRHLVQVFGEIQAMEQASLEAWAKQREQTK